MNLSDNLITLRAVEPTDLDALFILENDPAAAESGFTTAPPSRRQLWEYIETYDADIHRAGQLRLMIVDNASGEVVGAVDLSDYVVRDRRAFVGIVVKESCRRKGFGRAALGLLCRYAGETLGLHSLAAQIAVDNAASRAVFEAAGFRTCGCMRSWLRRGKHYADVLIYQKLFE